MRPLRPVELVIVGFILVTFGCAVPFLMVVHVLEVSFFLSFLSYGASVAGLLLGIYGASTYVQRNRR
ncbi:MAG: hypothetical protein IT318_02690 [Anaerolineales bacterium]|nr:hypothetical protein [Anaerolineales bacterium]